MVHLLLFHVLLTFYFLNPSVRPGVTVQTHISPQVLQGTCKVTFLCNEGITQKFCGSKACPASPCSKLTLAAPAWDLTGSRLWKRHSVSIRYHLVVPTAPAQSGTDSLQLAAFPGSQTSPHGEVWRKRRCCGHQIPGHLLPALRSRTLQPLDKTNTTQPGGRKGRKEKSRHWGTPSAEERRVPCLTQHHQSCSTSTLIFRPCTRRCRIHIRQKTL